MKFFVKVILAVATAILCAVPATAQDRGIDFKSMKVGTAAHYVDSSGKRFVYTYKQKLNSGYRVSVTGVGRHERYYDNNGFLIRIGYKDYQAFFRPFYCQRKVGKCQYNYNAEQSKYDGIWIGNLRRDKNGFHYTETTPQNRPETTSNSYIKFGEFNFFSEFVYGDKWFKLEKITVPK